MRMFDAAVAGGNWDCVAHVSSQLSLTANAGNLFSLQESWADFAYYRPPKLYY